MIRKTILATAASLAVISTAAFAAVTFDSTTGTGFVGKGDVQFALGYNNAQLQANAASLVFTAVSETVTEVSWTCTNDHNANIQERARTTTTSISGVVNSVARVRNQITGFNLEGYDGTETSSSTTEGPRVNSCPAAPSTWVLSTEAGDPETVSSSSVLKVNNVEL